MIYTHDWKDQISKDVVIWKLLFLWQHGSATPVYVYILVVTKRWKSNKFEKKNEIS